MKKTILQKSREKWYQEWCEENPDGYRLGQAGRPPLAFQAKELGMTVKEVKLMNKMNAKKKQMS